MEVKKRSFNLRSHRLHTPETAVGGEASSRFSCGAARLSYCRAAESMSRPDNGRNELRFLANSSLSFFLFFSCCFPARRRSFNVWDEFRHYRFEVPREARYVYYQVSAGFRATMVSKRGWVILMILCGCSYIIFQTEKICFMLQVCIRCDLIMTVFKIWFFYLRTFYLEFFVTRGVNICYTPLVQNSALIVQLKKNFFFFNI